MVHHFATLILAVDEHEPSKTPFYQKAHLTLPLSGGSGQVHRQSGRDRLGRRAGVMQGAADAPGTRPEQA
jgi:hypothetical protein